jgi:hypothetical protein
VAVSSEFPAISPDASRSPDQKQPAEKRLLTSDDLYGKGDPGSEKKYIYISF